MNTVLLTAEESVEDNFFAVLSNAIGNGGIKNIIAKYGEKLIWAIIIVIVGIVLTNRLLKILMRHFEKSQTFSGISKFIYGAASFVLYFIIILTASSFLGIPINTVLTIFSVFTLAFSLAIKDVIALFASGITIVASKPFMAGDLVEIPEENVLGYVSKVGLIHTHLLTADNKEIIIPNSIVAADTLINYSKVGLRRLDVIYHIGYKTDIQKAKAVIAEVIKNEPLVSKEKDAVIGVSNLGDSSVDIICKVYTKWDQYDFLCYRLNEKIKIAFDENNIEIPYNQIDVNLKQGE